MSEVKCSCQHCNGHIAFPAEMAGQMFACPHCGLETKLYVANVSKAPGSNPPQNVSVEIKRGVSPLGIASLVLGIIACVFCWIPLLGLLAVPVALIGLLLALVGIIMAGVNKKTGFVFPISGAAVCLLSVFIAFAITGGLAAAVQNAVAQGKKTNQETESKSTSQKNGDAEGWSKSMSVKQGGVEISITQIIPYPNVGLIIIDVDVKNFSDTKKIDFTTWGWSYDFPMSGPEPIATDSSLIQDNFQNKYRKYEKSESDYDSDSRTISIYPGKEFQDYLAFEAPIKNIQWLHLELPAKNFGGEGMIRFEIPASEIKSK